MPPVTKKSSTSQLQYLERILKGLALDQPFYIHTTISQRAPSKPPMALTSITSPYAQRTFTGNKNVGSDAHVKIWTNCDDLFREAFNTLKTSDGIHDHSSTKHESWVFSGSAAKVLILAQLVTQLNEHK
ncbi:hypothetical protein PMZ80_008459 [Knufia obscura]|uniref:Uncharacterized protein n=2 Tax=Knufia TaxID=430999 RepID=A0AAN8EBD2_9EURO|nr:hypothetical protein PMZ80_008459 [Knufia obscura]KAK5951344.1 hypothetical protein OHC33_007762 [Knufia fluminis]